MRLLLFNLKTDANDDVLGFTTDWVNALAARFERVSVVTVSAGRLAVAANVDVHSVGKERGYSRPRRAVEFYRVLLGLLLRERFDACFAHMNHRFALLAWPLLALWHIPIVLWYAHSRIGAGARLAARLANRVVTSTAGGFPIETPKRRIIGQGIDTERFRPAGAGTAHGFKVLSLGRISPIKRIETLIDALSILAKEHPAVDFEAEIAGAPATREDERYLERLKRQAEVAGLAHRIAFTGRVAHRQAAAKFAAASCFVNLTDTDSLEKALLEAMSCATPVITCVGSFRQVMGDRLADRWMTPREDPRAVAVRIAELGRMNPRARVQLGEQLRDIVVRRHGLERLAASLEREIREVAPPCASPLAACRLEDR